MRPVVFTGDIFRMQSRGGITRYFRETIARLSRPVEVLAGWHQSPALRSLGVPVREAAFVPHRRGLTRPRALLNAAWDRNHLHEAARRGAILHPTYYRDPRSLPRSSPVVATVWDMTHERFAGLFRRRFWQAADSARWKRALCARADRIVCISEATRRDLLASIDVPEAKLHVIHAGAPDWSGVAARPMAGVPLPFFLWVGDRHGYKNFLPAMEAWAASAAGRATALLCVGGGPLSAEECRAAARCGALERVLHRAADDGELVWAYERAAGLLYLSRSEGFGLPVLEAMSLGCPIVGSAAAALPEVAGTLAILADPEDRESMAAGIERCLERGRTPEGSAALRARAALFTWDRCAREHERVYEALD